MYQYKPKAIRLKYYLICSFMKFYIIKFQNYLPSFLNSHQSIFRCSTLVFFFFRLKSQNSFLGLLRYFFHYQKGKKKHPYKVMIEYFQNSIFFTYIQNFHKIQNNVTQFLFQIILRFNFCYGFRLDEKNITAYFIQCKLNKQYFFLRKK